MQFDTSGVVPSDDTNAPFILGFGSGFQWSDLSPFVQGYVEALLQDAWDSGEFIRQWWDRRGAYGDKGPVAFSDVAPETLARIMEDCQRFRALHEKAPYGGRFWATRQKGLWTHETFPPLTVYLGDDGKVRFQ